MCVPSGFLHQSPDRLGVRILEFLSAQNPKMCMHHAFRLDSNTCSELVGITPNPGHGEKQPVGVRKTCHGTSTLLIGVLPQKGSVDKNWMHLFLSLSSAGFFGHSLRLN